MGMVMSETVVMHPFGMPLVHRGVLLFGVADGDEIERHKVFREVED